MGYLGSFVSIIGTRIPVLLALLAGLIFAIVRREKHPRISLLAGIYFGLSILMSVIGALVSLLPIFSREWFDISITQIGMVMSGYGIFAAFLNAGLVVLLILAIFGGRAELDEEGE
jgi:O-antigen ligase